MDIKGKVVEKINEISRVVKESEAYARFTNAMHNDEYRTTKEKILERIEAYDKIIILRHTRPDGDAIGSALGLREVLRNKYKDKEIYAFGEEIPAYLKFVGSQDTLDDSKFEGALVIVVDTATKNRISYDKTALAKEVIKIDHHIPVEDYGTLNLVKENYGSCSLVLTDFFLSMNLEITKEAARYLYIAVVTDTGRFKFKETDATALSLSACLLEKGIDTESIYANLYTKDKNLLKLQGYVYKHINYTKNGVAWLYMPKSVMKKYKVTVEDASNCVNLLDSIKGSMIWMEFIEHDSEIRIRFRSRFVGVVKIAEKYNGGGHECAAGGTIYKKSDIKKVLEDADLILAAYKKVNNDKF